MKQTPARSKFKEHFGQANHFLVTNLVALHHLEASDVISASPELHTTWSPKNKRNSINRTWDFTLQTALTSAVDAIDMYISLLYRWPNYIRNQSLCSELDSANHSVQKKVLFVSNHYEINRVTVAMVDILITWRNNVVHELAENELREDTLLEIERSTAEIATKYRGLDPTSLPEKTKRGADLTFKEAASLINAAHNFVQEVDAAVLANLDVKTICSDLVRKALDDQQFRQKYYSLTPKTRRRFVENWLANKHGISNIESEYIDGCLNMKFE